jgi:hypothetical protein
MRIPALMLGLTFAVGLGGAALAQVAEGTYPGLLFCEATASSDPVRTAVTVTVIGGKAMYSAAPEGGAENGTGTLTAGQLTLTGRGSGRRPYEARYAGQASGRGGLLTGFHTGKGFKRACQISIGQGRA